MSRTCDEDLEFYEELILRCCLIVCPKKLILYLPHKYLKRPQIPLYFSDISEFLERSVALRGRNNKCHIILKSKDHPLSSLEEAVIGRDELLWAVLNTTLICCDFNSLYIIKPLDHSSTTTTATLQPSPNTENNIIQTSASVDSQSGLLQEPAGLYKLPVKFPQGFEDDSEGRR